MENRNKLIQIISRKKRKATRKTALRHPKRDNGDLIYRGTTQHLQNHTDEVHFKRKSEAGTAA